MTSKSSLMMSFGPHGHGWAASLLVHIAALSALISVPLQQQATNQLRFAARRLETTMIMLPAEPDVVGAAVSQINVEVRPADARIAQQRFRMVPTNDSVDINPAPQREQSERTPLEEQPPDVVVEDVNETARKTLSRVFAGAPPRPVAPAIEIGVTTLPEFGNNRPPVYPNSAVTKRQEGTVLLQVDIAANGKVTQVIVIESSQVPVLDAAAVSAVKTWNAKPATQNGRAVPTTIRLPVKFRLPK